MRKAVALVALVAGLSMLPFLVATQGIDVSIAQRAFPVCNPGSATRVLQYNVLDGHWHCRAAGGMFFLGGTQTNGGAGVDAMLTKKVTGLLDATATTLLTVTVPNTSQAATIPIVLTGTLGAGGAIGAGECSATAYGQIVLARTPGVATVATATALADTGSACVAGATTVTLAYAVTAMVGAVTVPQTFTVTGTVTKGAGSSTGHQIVIQADLINSNPAGVTFN
jgi:hypothetical protein